MIVHKMTKLFETDEIPSENFVRLVPFESVVTLLIPLSPSHPNPSPIKILVHHFVRLSASPCQKSFINESETAFQAVKVVSMG